MGKLKEENDKRDKEMEEKIKQTEKRVMNKI
jgi:hypothetical protein